MRFECTFAPAIIPVSYQFMFASFIKYAISLSKEQKVEELYTFAGKSNKQTKGFTYSVYLHGFKQMGDEITVHDQIKWIISSNDPEFMLYLYNGILAAKIFNYQGYSLKLQNIRFLKEKLPKASATTFSTLSPLAIKNKNGQFLSPQHPEYEAELNYICNLTLLHNRGEGLKQPLEFKNINMKKHVVQLKHEAFKSLNQKSILYVEAYKGLFQLKGNIEDLQFLSVSGIGFKRSIGFGNVQVL